MGSTYFASALHCTWREWRGQQTLLSEWQLLILSIMWTFLPSSWQPPRSPLLSLPSLHAELHWANKGRGWTEEEWGLLRSKLLLSSYQTFIRSLRFDFQKSNVVILKIIDKYPSIQGFSVVQFSAHYKVSRRYIYSLHPHIRIHSKCCNIPENLIKLSCFEFQFWFPWSLELSLPHPSSQ